MHLTRGDLHLLDSALTQTYANQERLLVNLLSYQADAVVVLAAEISHIASELLYARSKDCGNCLSPTS